MRLVVSIGRQVGGGCEFGPVFVLRKRRRGHFGEWDDAVIRSQTHGISQSLAGGCLVRDERIAAVVGGDLQQNFGVRQKSETGAQKLRSVSPGTQRRAKNSEGRTPNDE